ncbi:MAG: OmpA family protein [Spirochaetaceae bacterium]|nr:OmpA family protein [Spirochaetaceae bacterium]
MKRYFLRKFLISIVFILFALNINLFSQQATSQSIVDWTKPAFFSTAELDISESNIVLPSGRGAAKTILESKIPLLIKDPLLSLPVDSSLKLGDTVLQDTLSLEEITNIIQDGKQSASVYSNEKDSIIINHTIKLNDISSKLVKHSFPYKPNSPIEKTATRKYTGIIIDARGVLPVQGEFVTSTGNPCLFPKVWNEEMELIYEKNIEDSKVAKELGIVNYHWSSDENLYRDRIGNDPLRITAKKIFGINRTDPVISKKDALKILSLDENRELLKQGRVIILLDKEQLVYSVGAPEKNDSYYVVYRDTKNFFYERKIPDVEITDTYKGIQISIQDIKFVADSSEILPEEKERLDAIYEELHKITKNNEFTIMVEGHTASVGKPIGEMNLSVERAGTIINQLVERGMNRNIFSYKGYGGTLPIGDNSTNEGRAQNRRVEIIIIPKATYIQRVP